MIRPILFFVILSVSTVFATDFPLLDSASEWKFLNGGPDQGSEWSQLDFDDSAWETGLAPFGYGSLPEPPNTQLERLGPLTVYFRTHFEVLEELLPRFKLGVIELARDDGAVVYINGVEVRRDNLPEGEITFETAALRTIGGQDETVFTATRFSPDLLVPGTNLIAVELHNSSPGSADLYMGLTLVGRDEIRPLGSSRPPCVIDFESEGFGDGQTFLRSLDPNYTGIEFSYSRIGVQGQLQRTSGAPLESSALSARETHFSLTTQLIDLQNYTNVRVSLDLLVDGSLSPSSDHLTATLITGGGENLTPPEEISWLNLRPSSFSYTAVVEDDHPLRYIVPTGPEPTVEDWIQLDFDDSGWTPGVNGLGYELLNTYTPFIATDVETEMRNKNASVNLRIPFTVTGEDLADTIDLALEMRYDDGFVAWINGTEVARRNAGELLWNSEATATNPDTSAVVYERIQIPEHLPLLQLGENVLAIRGLNRPSGSSDMLIQARLLVAKPAEQQSNNLGRFLGNFRTVTSSLGLIPDSADALTIQLEGENGFGGDTSYYLDNISVTGTPITADSFATALFLDGIDSGENQDLDGDGVELLLEYAFGGSFSEPDLPEELMPEVDYDPLGFMTVRFRMLEGLLRGDVENGYDVADLRYTPQLSYDLENWRDGLGVPPFEQLGDIVSNGDGTVSVTLRSRRRLQTERERAFFRLKVEVARPVGVTLQ